MIGYTVCLTAGIARQLMLAPENPDLGRGIQSGLAAMRKLHLEGYGRPGASVSEANLLFPHETIADELAQATSAFAVAEVQDPVRFSVEPGIYLPEFGVRSEVNVFIDGGGQVHVTGGDPQTGYVESKYWMAWVSSTPRMRNISRSLQVGLIDRGAHVVTPNLRLCRVPGPLRDVSAQTRSPAGQPSGSWFRFPNPRQVRSPRG